MKKIMFNDRYGLTQAVIEGRKTTTRRIEGGDGFQFAAGLAVKIEFQSRDSCILMTDIDGATFLYTPRFKLGEVVAVAQSYEQVYRSGNMDADDAIILGLKYDPGMSNKMYVRADLMPHRIRITGIRCERLQDINYEDCLKEGVIELEQGYSTFLYCPNPYKEEGYLGGNMFQPKEAAVKKAFALMIDNILGRWTWARDPWVIVYEFELVK